MLVLIRVLSKYREYDREADSKENFVTFLPCTVTRDLDKLTESIKQSGIKTPGTLTIYKNKALLTEGNHRLAAAIRLNMEYYPLDIEYYDDIEDDDHKNHINSRLDNFVEIDEELENEILGGL